MRALLINAQHFSICIFHIFEEQEVKHGIETKA